MKKIYLIVIILFFLVKTTLTFSQPAKNNEELITMIRAVNFTPWIVYGENLKTCSPILVYNLPSPDVMYILLTGHRSQFRITQEEFNSIIQSTMITAKIYGWSGDKCHIVMHIKNSDGKHPNKDMVVDCLYSKDLLPVASDLAKKTLEQIQNNNAEFVDIAKANAIEDSCRQIYP